MEWSSVLSRHAPHIRIIIEPTSLPFEGSHHLREGAMASKHSTGRVSDVEDIEVGLQFHFSFLAGLPATRPRVRVHRPRRVTQYMPAEYRAGLAIRERARACRPGCRMAWVLRVVPVRPLQRQR